MSTATPAGRGVAGSTPPASSSWHPPEDPDTEAAFVGALLVGRNEALVMVRALISPGDFTRSTHRAVYSAALALHERGDGIDFTSVAAELRARPGESGPTLLDDIGGPQALLGLVGRVDSWLHIETYARRLALLGLQRRMVQTTNDLMRVTLMPRPDDTVGTLLERYESVLETVLRSGATQESAIRSSDEVAHDYFATLSERMDRKVNAIGYPLGFPELDLIMALRPGELVYIAGEPGTGKTGLMGTLADSLVDRHPAVPSLFASIEQPLPQLMDRIVAHHAGIDSVKLAKGWLSPDEMQLAALWLETLAKRPLRFVDDGMLTTSALDAHVQLAVAKHGVRVVFVDYTQKLADMPGEDPVRRIAHVSDRLRQIAYRHNVCVVAGSQVNAEGKLRWARELEQDAFIILLLRRGRQDDEAKIEVVKNRNGPAGIFVPVYFDRRSAHFSPSKPVKEGDIPT